MTRALACLIHNSHHYFIDVTILVQQGWRCWKHASHLRRINRGAICREPTVLYWVAGPSTIRHCLYRPCRRRQPTHIALILPILEQVTLSRTSDRSNICWRSNCVCVCVCVCVTEWVLCSATYRAGLYYTRYKMCLCSGVTESCDVDSHASGTPLPTISDCLDIVRLFYYIPESSVFQ